MAQSPPKRPSLSGQIKDALIAQMTTGVLGPGDRLIEMKIAEDMQTSQAPVREAIRELEALGLVESRRNRGAIVRVIDLDELTEIYAVRAQLESWALTLFAENSPNVGQMLLELCEQMTQAVQADDVVDFAHLNQQFHRCIIEASGNRTLLATWDRLDIQTRTTANLMRPERNLQRALDEHRTITSLILSGDIDAAREALVAHINDAPR